MMKRFLTLAAVVLACVGLASAQGPQYKSQEELDAILAIQDAIDPVERAEAAKFLLTAFSDTEFKEMAYYMLMISYQQLDDFDNMMVYGERTLEINPQNPGVLLQLSYAIPTRTREFDLDKEEKLTTAEGFASSALTLIPNLQKINQNVSDEEWLETKKDFMAQANESLGIIEAKRANYDEAAAFLTKAVGLQPQQNPMTHYHLADAYMNAGKKADAITAINRSITLGGVPLGGGADAAKTLKTKIEAMP
jgi:tetratricopeptide (TPR) repeat protein